MDLKYFYDYLIKMDSIAKIGLKFSTDPYAIDNYKEVQKHTTKMLEDFMNVSFDRPNYFMRDLYPTPNISVRTIIRNENNEVLFVSEANENAYSLPGGWCDLYDSPTEAAKNEVSQEAGLEVEITRLVGVLNHTPFKNDKSIPEYVIVFEGKPLSSFHEHTYETNDVRYFPIDKLPKLSRKVKVEEIKRMLNAVLNGETIFD